MTWQGNDPAKWAGDAEAMLTALLRNSVQALGTEMSTTIPNGGRVPVESGELGRSVVVDNKPPVVSDALATGDFSLGIANIKPGEPVYIGYSKKYAARQNYGFVGTDKLGRSYNQQGHGFVEAAAAKWDQIVREQATKLRNR